MLASGRLCEMVGSKALDMDRFLRQLGLRQLAEEDAQHLRAPWKMSELLSDYSVMFNL